MSVMPVAPGSPRVLVFSTLGHGSNEETRIRELLADLGPEVFPFDRTRKFRMLWRLLGKIRHSHPDLVVMEGTGLAGGLALIAARLLFGQRYAFSSGDAVGPWVASHVRLLGPLFGLYERLLCRYASGFIGWTPYLVGRALTFGAPRGVTAAGWAPFRRSRDEQSADRERTRARLGIPAGNLVIGIAGSMVWVPRVKYCYGWELVEAACRIGRTDVTFLLVGDGNGKARLEARAAGLPTSRVIFTGRVPQEELPAYYAAMDVASLPQSVDKVGAFRYTTKLSEYLAFGLPTITGQIPLAYDMDSGWIWRLPGAGPWTEAFLAALTRLVDELTLEGVQAKRAAVPGELLEFDPKDQAKRVAAFARDLCAI